MTELLESVASNALFQLSKAMDRYREAEVVQAHEPHAMAVLFRKWGAARMLTTGVAQPLFDAQRRAAAAYLDGLGRTPNEDRATSRGMPFFDAVAGQYGQAAVQIIQASRKTHNPRWEHEDDFLYVFVLMKLAFPEAFGEPEASRTIEDDLERWDEILDGDFDERMNVCRALHQKDEEAFQEAFNDLALAREDRVLESVANGKLLDEDAAWHRPIWIEGAALLRLAETQGWRLEDPIPMVPRPMRIQNPLPFHHDCWREPLPSSE